VKAETPQSRLTGMLGFTIIWIGQMFSLMGTNMTGFATTFWAYFITHQATALALVGFFNFAPIILASPIAGAIIDRYSRKKIMMLADLFAGLPTIVILLLYSTGNLQVWHLYITGAITGTFQSFHFPAYSAAVTMLVRKEQYGRANGMLATAQFATAIFAPIVAALLLTVLGNDQGIKTAMSIDIITFTIAISMLFFVHIPRPATTEVGRKGTGSIWKESVYGFRYIYERPSLLGLQLVFFFVNLVGSFSNTLIAPMILARAGDEAGKIILGSVMSAGGVGGLAGSIAMMIWGGPKRRVHGVLGGMMCLSLLGGLLMGFGQGLYVWALASFLGLFFLPIINGSNQAIWQAKVAPDVQGRVFSTRLLIAQISVPIAMLMAGPLADIFFEPAMMPTGSLAPIFGTLVDPGPGAGMLLMFITMGILGVFVAVGGYSVRVVRKAEDILPDHDAKPAPESGKPT